MNGRRHMTIHWFRRVWLAWLLWALSVMLLGGYSWLRAAANTFVSVPNPHIAPHVAEQLKMSGLGLAEDLFLHSAYLVFSTLGAFIVARRPANVIGWIFCIVGF